MESKPQKKVFSNEVIKERWQKFAPIYEPSDSSNQTFFYTLVNMLDLKNANNILEIGCGSGKLIPYAASLKLKQAKYFASDISQTMISMCRKFLSDHNTKIGVTDDLETWLTKQNVQIKLVNGEKNSDVPYKFDRIICNLVLQIAEDPVKMLKNFYDLAQPGCLLGVTVWGDKKSSNFLTLKDEALTQLGRPLPDVRENFHLYNRLPEVAQESGWELVLQWDQMAPYPYYELTDNLKNLNDYSSMMDKDIIEITERKIKQTFREKKPLNFQAQLAILRRK